MYFDLLKAMLSPDYTYNIYIDTKDSRSQKKVNELKNILRNSHYDFSQGRKNEHPYPNRIK